MRKWARELTGEAGGDLAGPCLPLPTRSAMTAPASFPPSPGVSLDLYRSLLCSASALPPAVYCQHKIFNKGAGHSFLRDQQ